MAKRAKLFRPDDAKLRELILLISSLSEGDPTFGAVKLNKLLFHCDFSAYLTYGRPITGQEYFALKQGPAPRRLLPITKRMQARQESLPISRRNTTVESSIDQSLSGSRIFNYSRLRKSRLWIPLSSDGGGRMQRRSASVHICSSAGSSSASVKLFLTAPPLLASGDQRRERESREVVALPRFEG